MTSNINLMEKMLPDLVRYILDPQNIAKLYLTAEHRVAALRQLRETILIKNSTYFNHPDLMDKRIYKDESDIAAVVDLLENDWTNPVDKDPSVAISTGAAATPEVSNDLLHALQKGEEAYQIFQEKHLQEGKGFRDTIKKMNLKRLGEAKSKRVKGTNREIILKADRRLFGTMILIAKNRKLDMHAVFYHPLGPLPWSLARWYYEENQQISSCKTSGKHGRPSRKSC